MLINHVKEENVKIIKAFLSSRKKIVNPIKKIHKEFKSAIVVRLGQSRRKNEIIKGYTIEWPINKFTLFIPAKYFATVIYSLVSWKLILVENTAKIIRAKAKTKIQIFFININ